MCNKEITINKESNNLKRPVTAKIAITAFILMGILIAPQLLNVIYPNIKIIQFITEGKWWYMYIGAILCIALILDLKYLKNNK